MDPLKSRIFINICAINFESGGGVVSFRGIEQQRNPALHVLVKLFQKVGGNLGGGVYRFIPAKIDLASLIVKSYNVRMAGWVSI